MDRQQRGRRGRADGEHDGVVRSDLDGLAADIEASDATVGRADLSQPGVETEGDAAPA